MNHPLQGTVNLPGSKSESNRVLMIAAYGGFPLEIDNLSCAHDTVLLQSLLRQVKYRVSDEPLMVNCEDAGSVARFMMTYLACRPGTWLLTGTPRLCERPVAPLIVALRQLGAEIECLGDEGLLPVRINGKALEGGNVKLDTSLSSQFASSLLLAAPTWSQGLNLELAGQMSSLPYIDMTVAIMRHFGAEVVRHDRCITVRHRSYQCVGFAVSADWSAASYWYEMLALNNGGNLLLKGLRIDSLQGDAVVADLFKLLGVSTEQVADGVCISSKGSVNLFEKPLQFDFTETPDLFPSIFVSCVALHIRAEFFSLMTLYNKESDRVNSLISELLKKYTFINIIYDNKIVIDKSFLLDNEFNNRKIVFNTHQDHRIAMALAGLMPILCDISFDNPEVVNKSYPTFWKEVQNVFQT